MGISFFESLNSTTSQVNTLDDIYKIFSLNPRPNVGALESNSAGRIPPTKLDLKGGKVQIWNLTKGN